MIKIARKVFLKTLYSLPLIDVVNFTSMKQTLVTAAFRHPRNLESNALMPNFSRPEATPCRCTRVRITSDPKLTLFLAYHKHIDNIKEKHELMWKLIN